jgi:hypothetical protein
MATVPISQLRAVSFLSNWCHCAGPAHFLPTWVGPTFRWRNKTFFFSQNKSGIEILIVTVEHTYVVKKNISEKKHLVKRMLISTLKKCNLLHRSKLLQWGLPSPASFFLHKIGWWSALKNITFYQHASSNENQDFYAIRSFARCRSQSPF